MVQLLLPLGMAVLLSMPLVVHAQPFAKAGNTHPNPERPINAAGVVTRAMAVELALQANPEIAVAIHEIEAAEGAIRQAGVIRNPELVTSVEDTRYRETRTTTVQINQPLELGGKRSARIAAADRAHDLAIAELDAKRADIRATVTAAFYDVLSAQERLRLAQASVDLAQRATVITSKRVAAGKVSPVDETRARVAESGIRVELAQAESELAAARNRLAATWGARQVRFERVDGGVNDLPLLRDWNELATRLARSPNLERARIEVDRRQALTRVERSRRIPDITVSVGAMRDEQLGRNQAILGISIPLPLFDRNQGNVQEAASRAYQAQDQLVATEVRLESELAQLYARLRSMRTEAELFQKEILPGAQSAYDAATKGFEFGKFSFLDVLDAQRTLFQATAQYLRALSEAHRTAADIERIVGEPLQALQQ
ncbi:TolC family protein [Oxalobacteraceae bacterium R-40]|uniref:TolC family protein n=1 Tax=Keguizhuia sedimenti TaxID=3064264 RepID=A0ABU1BTJ5_9BURK|nr:TolC family protein [Oxalobacteraceae bacterium R-40]